MFYKTILIILMLPAIAFGQYAKPSEGTTNADSIRGAYINTAPSVAQDGKVLQYFISGDSMGWVTAGGGEANTLSDSGTYNGTTGFGLAAGKTGVALKVKGLIEGSNISITLSGDSALVITASGGSGVWTERSDTLFAVDADGDTIAVMWDDDAGNVTWQVATEDQNLRILADTLGIGETSPDKKLHITGNSVTLKLEDDSGNWGALNVGNSQICLGIDPDDLVTSSDICFDIDGSEVARFHQSTDFGVGTLSPPEKISAVGNIATGDTAAGDVDVFHYFSTDGSWITEYLKWDDGDSEFQLSDDLNIGGTITSSDTLTGSFVIASPDATFDFPFWQTKRAITIVAVSAVCTGGTNVIGALQEYNATGTAVDAAVDGDWTITTSEYTDASFTNPGIDAGDWLGWKTTSVSGSVTFFSITFEYTE